MNFSFLAPIITDLRKSKLRRPILRLLLQWDNKLKGIITLFAFEDGAHPRHRITQYHKFFVDNVSPSDSVLDVGCNTGHLTRVIGQKVSSIIGIDIDEAIINQAKQYSSSPSVKHVVGDATSYFTTEHFDVVVLSNVLEHIENRTQFLKDMGRIGTKILVRVPMFDRDWLPALKKELGIEYRLDPGHFTEYTEREFRDEIAKAGLTIQNLAIRYGELYAVLTSR